jgi:hypothetical protein
LGDLEDAAIDVDYLPFSCRLIFSGLSWMSAVSTGVGFGSRI